MKTATWKYWPTHWTLHSGMMTKYSSRVAKLCVWLLAFWAWHYHYFYGCHSTFFRAIVSRWILLVIIFLPRLLYFLLVLSVFWLYFSWFTKVMILLIFCFKSCGLISNIVIVVAYRQYCSGLRRKPWLYCYVLDLRTPTLWLSASGPFHFCSFILRKPGLYVHLSIHQIRFTSRKTEIRENTPKSHV